MAGIKLFYDTTCTSTSGVCCLWTVPTGVYSVTFEIWGGGGGGGTKGTSCNCCDRGGPGAGGGYSKVTIPTTPGTQYTLCAGNAGVSTSGYGSLCGLCCNGCNGGTSYVTGTGLSNFCAVGGCGGASDFNTVCYSHCGCNYCSRGGGCGYGGDVSVRGHFGVIGMHAAQNPCYIVMKGGDAGGPGGGAGGVNVAGGWAENRSAEAVAGESPLHGRVPGGGGAGSGCWTTCVCTAINSGRGAPGAVKIYY